MGMRTHHLRVCVRKREHGVFTHNTKSTHWLGPARWKRSSQDIGQMVPGCGLWDSKAGFQPEAASL